MAFDLRHIYMVATSNFLEQVSSDMDARLRGIALKRLGDKRKNRYGETIPDFIIFDPDFESPLVTKYPLHEKYEDDNRSLRISMPGLPGKVYVKLDDYGSPETLSEQVGHKVRTQFVITLMMAEDY